MTTYTCPWCAFECETEYNIHLHIEEHHTEGSPFVTRDEVSTSTPSSAARRARSAPDHRNEASVTCTRPGCGKHIYLDEIDEHLAIHESEEQEDQQQVIPELSAALIHQRAERASRSGAARRVSSPIGTRSQSILNFLAGRSGPARRKPLEQHKDRGRLGTKELGQHAFEKSMPSSVRRTLEDAATPSEENRITQSGRITRYRYYRNETLELIPVLADIAALDNSTITYFSHASTKHIHRIRCDGNFCGYWNIQMLHSHILTITASDRGLPTVLQMQDIIEKAWSNNICSYGRIETGGVFNTRKWIGTHEALAFFRQLDTNVSASSFQRQEQPAYLALLDFVEAYFLAGVSAEHEGYDAGSIITQLPPIYLQRAGHSVTIVGLTRQKNGERHLLIFDPSHDTTTAMSRVLDGRSVHALPETLLKPYRWSENKLAAWDEYEVLIIDASQSLHQTDRPRAQV